MQVLTYFDKDSWSLNRRNWFGSNGSGVFAFCSPELDDDSKREIDRTFASTYYCDVRFDRLCNFLLSKVFKEGNDYLLVAPDIHPPFDIVTNKDAFCKAKKVTDLEVGAIQTTDCILNLSNRVEFIRSLEKKGVLLDSSLILGSADFWIAFVGFQNYLKDVEYLNSFLTLNYADLVLNLFYHSSSSFSLEVEK